MSTHQIAAKPLCWWMDTQFGLALLLPLPAWLILSALGSRPATSWWMLLLVAPLVEEFAFRGTLQGALLRTTVGKIQYGAISLANLITAALFGGAHAIHHSAAFDLLTFFPGLVFGYFRERYSLLLPAILLHSYYNLGLLW